MMIFCNCSIGVVAIPQERIYKTTQASNQITISYDGGEMTWLDEERYVRKISYEKVVFETEELATANMQDFYRACRDGKSVFYFG